MGLYFFWFYMVLCVFLLIYNGFYSGANCFEVKCFVFLWLHQWILMVFTKAYNSVLAPLR